MIETRQDSLGDYPNEIGRLRIAAEIAAGLTFVAFEACAVTVSYGSKKFGQIGRVLFGE